MILLVLSEALHCLRVLTRSPYLLPFAIGFLVVRGFLLISLGEDATLPEQEMRARLSLALISVPLSIYLAMYTVTRDRSSASSILSISGKLGWSGFLLGRGLGGCLFLACFWGMALIADVGVFSFFESESGEKKPRPASRFARYVPGEREITRDSEGYFWLRKGKGVATFRFAPSGREGRAEFVYARARVRWMPGAEQVSRSIGLTYEFSDLRGNGENGEEPETGRLLLSGACGVKAPVPDWLADGGQAFLLHLSVPSKAGVVGLEQGRIMCLGAVSAYPPFYAKTLLSLLALCCYLHLITVFVSASISGLVGLGVSLGLTVLGSVRHLLLEAIGTEGFEASSQMSWLLALQVKLLRLVTIPSPRLSDLWSPGFLMDRVDLPLGFLASDAGVLALYCLPFFVIAWALCWMREGR